MSKQDYSAEHGPSWVDVEKCIDHIEGTFVGYVSISIERHQWKDKVYRTLVRCAFFTNNEGRGGKVRVARQVWWDRREFKTITAVLYNQLLQIDNWLTKEQEEAERQATLL